MRRILSVLLVFLLLGMPLSAQDNSAETVEESAEDGSPQEGSPAEATQSDEEPSDGAQSDSGGEHGVDAPGAERSTTPEPYRREEFPEWAWQLRRAEVVAVGTFPIAMIASGLLYQVGRYAAQDFDQRYAPWFFSTSTGPRYDQNERVGLIVSGAVISVGVALLDYWLGRREARRERR